MNERAWLVCGLVVGAAMLAGCQTNVTLREDGMALYRIQDYPGAEEKFQQAIVKAENDYEAHYWLGITQLKQNRPIQAQVNFERALAIRFVDAERYSDVLDGLAESYYQQGSSRYDNLSGFLDRTARERNTSRDYLRQGTYLARIGDVDGARTALKKGAYFAKRDDAHPYLVIADFYRGLNDRTNELIALRYAYYINPTHPGLSARIRALGTVPGPTVAVEPPKPEVLR